MPGFGVSSTFNETAKVRRSYETAKGTIIGLFSGPVRDGFGAGSSYERLSPENGQGGADLIVSMVQGQPGKYSLNAEELIRLKQAGVSEKILAAMAAKGSAAAAPAAPSSAAAATAGDPDIPQGVEIGVYYRKGTAWEEMLPEVVNWKSGGVIKHIASVGVAVLRGATAG